MCFLIGSLSTNNFTVLLEAESRGGSGDLSLVLMANISSGVHDSSLAGDSRSGATSRSKHLAESSCSRKFTSYRSMWRKVAIIGGMARCRNWNTDWM